MDIRLLRSDDAERYVQIRLEALQTSPEAFASSYEEEKKQTAGKYVKRFQNPQQSFTFGAFKDGSLVGVVTLYRENMYKLRHRANIVAMYVKQEARGKGIGKKLLLSAIQKAKNLDEVEQIYLTVVSSNERAKQLYSKVGFKVFGTDYRALKIGDSYFDEEYMVLYL
ncbi:GNAT family N-acetyltransferase [Salirhabdus salicampi]|uniref:GNAT family N-acetyltransferase n=1 Tax=Salirhabdus salicampi TaxID=476102 RepID=UPI0020C3500B|nr:GNAT family N-acetyltransferase [Salirhabdus salicampi]